MTDKIANIGVRVGADIRDYKRGMDEASRETVKFKGVAGGLTKSIGSMASALAAGAAAAFCFFIDCAKAAGLVANARVSARVNSSFFMVIWF